MSSSPFDREHESYEPNYLTPGYETSASPSDPDPAAPETEPIRPARAAVEPEVVEAPEPAPRAEPSVQPTSGPDFSSAYEVLDDGPAASSVYDEGYVTPTPAPVVETGYQTPAPAPINLQQPRPRPMPHPMVPMRPQNYGYGYHPNVVPYQPIQSQQALALASEPLAAVLRLVLSVLVWGNSTMMLLVSAQRA